ncbi:unnamed protein product [Didymodactylos carnosus]|uniref:Uncharacterized protein n=1 Tax=Didymodactylos carnosus TaxID=1234261 RepID=A0A814BAS4_9BILA|nr:unnamed protein product [Didymodactylos carnosus]CAF3704070.1 unnamed protein product [Didymodactylos carnosus]
MTDDKCPINAKYNRNATNPQCICLPGYSTSSDLETCELQLKEHVPLNNCIENNSSSSLHTLCADKYGQFSRFCNIGVCHCIQNVSYAYPSSSNPYKCVSYLNTPQKSNLTTTDCPAGSKPENNNECRCKPGYSETNKTSCDLNLSPGATGSDCDLLNSADGDVSCNSAWPYSRICKRGECRCDGSKSFYSLYSLRVPLCVVLLDTPQNSPIIAPTVLCPEHSLNNNKSDECRCDTGYRTDPNSNKQVCVKKSSKLYNYNENPPSPPAENITLIDDCTSVYSGPLEIVNASNSQNYCRCKRYSVKLNSTACFYDQLFLIGTGNMSDRSNCTRYKNDDCKTLYNDQAYCDIIDGRESCLCNRQTSFLNNKICQSFASFVYPSVSGLLTSACDTNNDCKIPNTECKFYLLTNYKLCQCKSGYFLNPKAQTCENNRCTGERDPSTNFICDGYNWRCQDGYYENTNKTGCVKITHVYNKPYQYCNASFSTTTTTSGVRCTECNRAMCELDYQEQDDKCVQNKFEDKCQHKPEICNKLVSGSSCKNNECGCYTSGTYRDDAICARAIGYECDQTAQCGNGGFCSDRECRCNIGYTETTVTDTNGKYIQRCVRRNNGRNIQYSLWLLVLLSIVSFINS